MSGAAQDADIGGGGENIAAIIAAAVDAFLREEAAETESAAGIRDRTKISAWRMAARRESGIGVRGYGASAAWRGTG